MGIHQRPVGEEQAFGLRVSLDRCCLVVETDHLVQTLDDIVNQQHLILVQVNSFDFCPFYGCK
jgi:hypothetical protein